MLNPSALIGLYNLALSQKTHKCTLFGANDTRGLPPILGSLSTENTPEDFLVAVSGRLARLLRRGTLTRDPSKDQLSACLPFHQFFFLKSIMESQIALCFRSTVSTEYIKEVTFLPNFSRSEVHHGFT